MSLEERRHIEGLLSEVYTREGVAIWMTRPHKLLGKEVPLDLIEKGEANRVLAIVAQLIDGAYV